MQIEKFVTALVQSIDNNDIISVLTDAQKQAIVAEFFAKADKDAILSVMPETLQNEFVADVEEEEEESEEEEDLDLDDVDPNLLVRYVGDTLSQDVLDYIDHVTLCEYVGENLKPNILEYLGITEQVDALRELLEIIE